MRPPSSNDEALAIIMDAQEATDEGDLARALPMYEALANFLRQKPPPQTLGDEDFTITLAMLLQNMATISHHQGNFESMLRYTTELLRETSESDAEAFSSHSVALQHLGRHDEAILASKKSVAIDPMSANGHYQHACILVGLGQLEDALESVERALDLGVDRDSVVADHDLAPLHVHPRWQVLVSDERQARVLLERFRAATKALDATAPTDRDDLLDWLSSDGTIDRMEGAIALADALLSIHAIAEATTHLGDDGSEVVNAAACTAEQRAALDAILGAGHIWQAIPFLNLLGEHNVPNLTAEDARVRVGLGEASQQN